MISSKLKLQKFTEFLDKTAEKNPLLWLPCILTLAVILGTEKLCSMVKGLALKLKAASARSEKPLLMRFTACAAAAAFAVCILPKSANVRVFADNEQDGTAVSEKNTEDNNDGKDENETEAPAGAGTENTDGAAERSKKQTVNIDKTSSEKKGISIALECTVENISKGTAHISTRKEFLNSSVVLKIMSSDEANEAANGVISKLGDMSGYYEFYPFDINLSDAESGSEIELMNGGFITVEMPIPKKMLKTPDLIKVYHIKDGMPETIESELVSLEGENPVVRFNVKEFSPYIFVIPSYEDVSSAAGSYDGSVPVETAAIPSANGVALPNVYGDMPKNLKCSNKKRRYRVLRKRNLDDMVFVY